MGLFDFFKRIKDEISVKPGDDSYIGNPFIDNAIYIKDEELNDKLYNAGFMWDTVDHNEENFTNVLIACELDDLMIYYIWNRKDSKVFYEEELSDIVMGWIIFDEKN